MDAKEVCRFFQSYSKQYMGSMFSSPLPADIEVAHRDGRLQLGESSRGIEWAVFNTLSQRTLRRKSFTGWVYEIPAGTEVSQHVAHREGEIPFPLADVVYIYQDDRALRGYVLSQGYELSAVKIAATSEILGVYSKDVYIPKSHQQEDEATLVRLPMVDVDREAVLAEVSRVTAYRDDYPYYNKNNSWAAASLRGYKPEDPLYGLKPSEMSRKWQAEHPEDMTLRECQDTTLGKKCPAIMSVLRKMCFGSGFDRVRLLRLGTGELTRHCDITDRDLGTRDGQICRFHIPLVTHPEVRSEVWGLWGDKVSKNLEEWQMYYMDIRKPHAARNMTNRERIHLQVDVVADERLREAIRRAM